LAGGLRIKPPPKNALQALGGSKALAVGRLLVRAHGGAVDVLGRFDGERAAATGGGVEAVDVITLTRVSLDRNDVAGIAVEMRRVADDVARALAAPGGAKPVVAVLDVFVSDAPNATASTELGANEALAVTSTTMLGDLDAAVGSMFAAHQRMHRSTLVVNEGIA